MEKKGLKFNTDTLLLILILSLYVIGFLLYPYLPEKVPSHWNIRGEVDGYTGKFNHILFMPTFTLGLFLLLKVVPKIDPRAENYKKFTGVYEGFKVVFVLFMWGIYIITLLAGLGYSLPVGKLVSIGVGVLFIFIGNYFGKIKHNYTFGIKTPWTLASEEVWNKTHRVSGPLWVIAGFLWIVSIFVSETIGFIVGMVSIFSVAIFGFVYSYIIYKKLYGQK
ncbi:SdpI family protein [Thermovenabulum gondwanense]|uniref:Immunity protein SdpI n=1 Tax=Thermovenabulum gondwanense TaxID=520767 RepID=A0A162M6M9_9FIRM|nr:SdpI family protein [Thermovenabulum gondwanense]KYO64322.1 Immunity protein SdpI [Thermovenabulum gondwanense]